MNNLENLNCKEFLRQETIDKQIGKTKKFGKNVFPPMWEMPTTNRFNDLDFEDNDILEDNNAPDDSFEIQLSNVKLKRKILYLQTKVRSSEPSVEHYSDNQDYQHA